MKINLIPAQANAPARSASQALQFRLRNLWLRELEQAQLGWWAGDGRAPAAGRAHVSAGEQPDDAAPAQEDSSGSRAPDLGAAGCAVLADLHARGAAARGADAHEAAQSGQVEGAPATARASAAPGRELAQAPGDREGAAQAAAEVRFFEPIPAQAQTPVPVATMDAGSVAANVIDPATKAYEAPQSAGATVPPAARQWPARSVHMMMDVSGTRVWVRDADLAHGNSAHVLSSLADELAQRGMRLRALTVNGRLVFEAEPQFRLDVGPDAGAAADAENHTGATADAPPGRLRQDSAGFETVFAKRR